MVRAVSCEGAVEMHARAPNAGVGLDAASRGALGRRP